MWYTSRVVSISVFTLLYISNSAAIDLTISGPASNFALVGESVVWTANSSGESSLRYRFRAKRVGSAFQMIRDYGTSNVLEWASDREGRFEIEASVRDVNSGEVTTDSQVIQIGSRLAGSESAVNPTNHPQVFLFSAPPCGSGGRMRVQFWTDGVPMQQTPYKNCNTSSSMNFYLAGLYADTTYTARLWLDSGTEFSQGEEIQFQTGSLPGFSWNQTVMKTAAPGVAQPILLATSGGSQIATDLNGRVMWFNPSPQSYLTRAETGGYFWGYLEDHSWPIQEQAIRKVDLLGHTILETNAERVNQQLAEMGKPAISGFHHEVRTLPDGRVAALASIEQMVTDLQGPGTVDVLGDMIIVFDDNMQVEWTWNAFDHLDVSRKATLNETCAPGGGGCSPFYLAGVANDWTHGNALQQTPDGNLLYSARHQDWLIKIDYENGEGDGHIIWRLGKDGDFVFKGSDSYPWFSHQHDGNFESDTRLTVFDNGNTRISLTGQGNSRGQVIELDEANRTATLILNADLGVNSVAVGSAQKLNSGNYHFDAGYVLAKGGITAYSLEVDKFGNVVSSLEANTLIYRSIRMASLYGPN